METFFSKSNHERDEPVSYTHLRAHETPEHLVCRLLLEPKKTGELVWKFSKNIDLEMACNVPGHYQIGMVGKIIIE